MKVFLIGLWLWSMPLWSQSIPKDIQEVNHQIGQSEVDQYLEEKSSEGIPGSVLGALLPVPALEPLQCEAETEPKNTHYEVVLIAEGSSQKGSIEILPGQTGQFAKEGLASLMQTIPETDSSQGLTHSAILNRATDIWNSQIFETPSSDFDPQSAIGRELFIEGLVHASAKSALNEKELSLKMADIIGSTYKTKEEKFSVLSALSLRLYRNYNNARNPGFNTLENNPDRVALPTGDMKINDLMKGAAAFNEFEGGVCNDISETVAMIGEHLFPNEDVLVVNSGTHFGVVIADGKEFKVIDGGDEIRTENQLLLSPKKSPTNLRINKVTNGALKEIAVVDTQMGQITEAAFQTGKQLLNTDIDISSLVAHYKNKNFGVSLGAGHLTDSEVLIVVAKYQTAGDKWKSHLGIGASAQDYQNNLDTKYQVHVRAGLERKMFHYVNSQTSLNFSSGLRMNGMYALKQKPSASIDLSMGVDAVNRLEFDHSAKNPSGIKLKSSLEVEHSLGPKNWGKTTGTMSSFRSSDMSAILKNMNFHLNQVNADVAMEKKLNKKLTGMSNVHYQGSAVGQNVSMLAGLNIEVPKGAELLVFAGHTNSKIPGFKTKQNLLARPHGFEAGAKYKNRRGAEVGGSVKGISGKPSVNATIKVPLNKPSR